MKLSRQNWDLVKLDNVIVDIKDGGTPSRNKPEYFGGNIFWCVVKDIKPEIYDTIEKLTEEGLRKCSSKLWPINSVIVSLGATIGQVGIAKVPVATKQGLSGIIVERSKISPEFLAIILNLKKEFIQSLATGTTIKEVRPSRLKEVLKFHLPPLDEQTQIAELFQSIETVIEQTEQQENSLLKLKKTLSNGLLDKKPVFGNLLNKKNCTLTNFGGVADCDVQHDKEKKDVSRFIGLENIEPENLKITTWGNIADGTTFTKRFSKGDVLFGKRRAYLKKVAVADFDGICSADILVLKVKEKKILKELLPFYVSSEAFINHAVSTSAGSLSPRTKWKDLSLLEISIPDLKTQGIILDVFQQIETTLSQLKTQKQTLKKLKQKLLNEILG